MEEYAEVARATSERGEIVLRRCTDPEAGDAAPSVLELRVNGIFVMDTRDSSSEIELARRALALVDPPRRVLVGGLGLGYLAKEVLAHHRVERVVVAEIEDVLVRWFRDGTIPHGPAYLADERLHLAVSDVRQPIEEAQPGDFDLVVLDVDNGPEFLVHEANAALYESAVLRRVHAALRVGGALAVWSSTRSDRLARGIQEVFGHSAAEPCPVLLEEHEETYWLHHATKRAEAGSGARAPEAAQPGVAQPEALA